MPATILVRGAGDLASGIALRLHRAGLNVVMTELAEPLAVRRTVSFAEAIYDGSISIEGVKARRIDDPVDTLSILQCLAAGHIPVLVDAQAAAAQQLQPLVIVDARMTKRSPEPLAHQALLYLGLGPGFDAPRNCHAVIETERGHAMGRVIWHGSAKQDSMHPDGDTRRVLRAPGEGTFESSARIGQHFEPGEVVGSVSAQTIKAPFAGTLRGLLRPGLHVPAGMKIGDLDPRDDPALCLMASDKSLAIGGGVLEAIFTPAAVRSRLWD